MSDTRFTQNLEDIEGDIKMEFGDRLHISE
jgi:hypothetical protein